MSDHLDPTVPLDGSRGRMRLMRSMEPFHYATNPVERTRRCWSCRTWKPLHDYHRNAEDTTYGRKRLCKACVTARDRSPSRPGTG